MKKVTTWAALAIASAMALASCSKVTDIAEPAREQGQIGFGLNE